MDLRPDLHLLGVSFRTASEVVREGLVFSPSQTTELLARAQEETPGVEAVVLSTCNRTEFYLSGPAGTDVVRAWHDLLRRSRPAAPALDESCERYERHGADAFRHLLRVVSGLESALLGDGQILGQVRRALALSQEAGALGGVLSPSFSAALRLGRQVRSQTDIGKGAPGVGAAVAETLAARHVPTDTRVLVLGSGEAARTIARALVKAGYRELAVAARNTDAAAQVATAVGASTVPWQDRACSGASVVVTATAAASPVLQETPAGCRLVVDAGFPRQVSQAVGEEGVELVSLLALTQQADAAAADRQAAVPAVESLIAEHVARWQLDRDRAPIEEAIKRLHVDAEAMARSTAAELALRTGAAPHDLEQLIVRQVRRVLHNHVSGLRTLQGVRP
jgi:glutamyl-tRNA reductase